MSMLRLCALVTVMVAGLAAAQTFGGAACPAASSVGALLDFPNSTCSSAGETCANTFCQCGGGTYSTSTRKCTYGKPSCATLSTCAQRYVHCVVGIAAAINSTSADCNFVNKLKTSLLLVAKGDVFNTSDAYKACANWVCDVYNASGVSGTDCSLPYEHVCDTPYKTDAKIRLLGSFGAILANSTSKKRLQECLSSDLSAYLRFPVNVTDIVALSDGSGVDASFTTSIQADNSAYKAQFEALLKLTTLDSVLVCTNALYKSLGGNGTIGFGGVPSTPAPTPPGGTNPPTPTTAAPKSGASSLSWTLAQMLVAILAVLVMA